MSVDVDKSIEFSLIWCWVCSNFPKKTYILKSWIFYGYGS